MPILRITNKFDLNFYTSGVGFVYGYGNDGPGDIPAVPIIHTYSPGNVEFIRFALKKTEKSPYVLGRVPYKVQRSLSAQLLDGAFFNDLGGDFCVTVKPHYAIAPMNVSGYVYNKACQTLISCDGKFLHNKRMVVSAHDGRVSPKEHIDALGDLIEQAFQRNESIFITSYVVDEVHKSIFITQHCLLNRSSYDALFKALEGMQNPTLEKLMEQDLSITSELKKFNDVLLTKELDYLQINADMLFQVMALGFGVSCLMLVILFMLDVSLSPSVTSVAAGGAGVLASGLFAYNTCGECTEDLLATLSRTIF
jgi:hypothetical protein